MEEDWVFATPASFGKLPYWSFSISRTYVKPALKEAKIASKVGGHTFRHFFTTILKAHGGRCGDGARAHASRQQR